MTQERDVGTTGDDQYPPLPWWPAPRPATGRSPLDRERIVMAALARIDADGLEALSMRNLGQDLGVAATTLYWHVASKDELLDLVIDRIIGEVRAEMVWGGDWQTQLATAGSTIRRVLLRHRSAAPLLGARLTLGPNIMAAMESLLGVLFRAGFDPSGADLAVSAILNHAVGWVLVDDREQTGPGGLQASSEEMEQVALGMLRSLPVGAYPNIRQITVEGAGHLDVDELFAYAQRCLIEGIAADRARRSDGSGRGARRRPGAAPRPRQG